MDNEKQKSDQHLIIRTQEDRSLLLKDLYGRLPYGVKFKADNEEDIREIYYIKDENVYIREYQNLPYWIDNIKPYLRPMSSMTEEERKELEKITHYTFEYEKGARDIWTKSYHKYHLFGGDGKLYGEGEPINMLCSSELCIKLIDWLNMHHFDYRHLIERGLALEAPEGLYNIREN